MLIIKIQNLNGDTLFYGYVPEEKVVFEGGITRPRTATISVPIEDPLAKLMRTDLDVSASSKWEDAEPDTIMEDIRAWMNAPSDTASA